VCAARHKSSAPVRTFLDLPLRLAAAVEEVRADCQAAERQHYGKAVVTKKMLKKRIAGLRQTLVRAVVH
jgi:hypothetical protein